MTYSNEVAVERLDRAVAIASELEKLGFETDVIPCWDDIPILKIRKTKRRRLKSDGL